MPRQYKASEIEWLLNHLSKKTNQSLDYYGLGEMSEMINGSITKKYLYDSLLRPINSGKEILSLAPNKVDEIVQYLGYDNFKSFCNTQLNPINPVLKSLEGNYYSYVRKNVEKGFILQSPVKVEEVHNEMTFNLRGPKWNYSGILEYVDGCLFCLMKSKLSGKSFHHVYNIGKSISPKVMMGVFSGVSSANNPIGGRCVLIRQADDFNILKNNVLSVQDMAKSTDEELRRLAMFFKDYKNNNLKTVSPIGFDFDDLL